MLHKHTQRAWRPGCSNRRDCFKRTSSSREVAGRRVRAARPTACGTLAGRMRVARRASTPCCPCSRRCCQSRSCTGARCVREAEAVRALWRARSRQQMRGAERQPCGPAAAAGAAAAHVHVLVHTRTMLPCSLLQHPGSPQAAAAAARTRPAATMGKPLVRLQVVLSGSTCKHTHRRAVAVACCIKAAVSCLLHARGACVLHAGPER
jgi:hypothetical protein